MTPQRPQDSPPANLPPTAGPAPAIPSTISTASLGAPVSYYSENFESGVLGPEFQTTTTNCGVVELTDTWGPADEFHVLMYADTTGCTSTANLTLTVDLTGATDVSLRFSFKDIDDEFDPGQDFVEVSDDGGMNWTFVSDLNPMVENVHATRTHDLGGLGLTFGSNFMVRWNWEDASPPPADGFGIDNIELQDFFVGTPPPVPQQNLVQHQATDLWALGYDGTGVTILNIDRGADYRHPDLANRIFVNPLDPVDGIDNDGNGYIDDHMGWDWIQDDNDPLPNAFFGEHGTNTAGIMVGDGSSGLARTGMAPGAKMAIARINGEAHQWLAIQWGLSVGIDCNSSSNSYKWNLVPKPDYHMHRVVHDMLLTAGVIHANSIGNLAGLREHPIPFQVTIPAACPAPWKHPNQILGGGAVSAVIAVGGIELDDTLFTPTSIGPVAWEDITLYDRAYPHSQNAAYWDHAFGGFGGTQQGLTKPDVVAYTNVVTTNGPSGYLTSFWGTSASTPAVGGAFALLLSVCPEATPAQICEALQSTAIDMGPQGKDVTYGAGSIQVLDAAVVLQSMTQDQACYARHLCFGDGGGSMGCGDCPCMNNALQGTQGGCEHSASVGLFSGSGARVIASGSLSISKPPGATDDLALSMEFLPPNSTAVMFSGSAVAPQNMTNPCFGMGVAVDLIAADAKDGLRCAVNGLIRHGNRQSDALGNINADSGPSRTWGGATGPPAGLGAFSGFTAGQTRYFQATFRDLPEQVCMTGLNTSQAVETTFQP